MNTLSNDNKHPTRDYIQPFLIDHTDIKGRWVRLSGSINTILSRHNYPKSVSHLLGELLMLTAMLSSRLKGQGKVTVQATGVDSAIHFLVVDANAKGELRGYADIAEGDAGKPAEKPDASLQELLGKGFLVVTLDTGNSLQPYQGVVALEGETITECFERYFQESEQFTVHLQTRIAHTPESGWQAAACMLQQLPRGSVSRPDADAKPRQHKSNEEYEEDWTRSCMLLDTITLDEMLSTELTAQELLYRLFHEDGVWVYDPSPLSVGCQCTRERIETMLGNMSQDELQDMVVNDTISVTCQFCNKTEDFAASHFDKKH